MRVTQATPGRGGKQQSGRSWETGVCAIQTFSWLSSHLSRWRIFSRRSEGGSVPNIRFRLFLCTSLRGTYRRARVHTMVVKKRLRVSLERPKMRPTEAQLHLHRPRSGSASQKRVRWNGRAEKEGCSALSLRLMYFLNPLPRFMDLSVNTFLVRVINSSPRDAPRQYCLRPFHAGERDLLRVAHFSSRDIDFKNMFGFFLLMKFFIFPLSKYFECSNLFVAQTDVEERKILHEW